MLVNILYAGLLALCQVARGQYCPPGSDYVDGLDECVLFNDVAIGWDGAEHICNEYHGHLVSLKSAFEISVVSSYAMRDLKGGQAYIGLFRNATNKDWTWADTYSVNYFKWASGQPGTANCVVLDVAEMAWRTVDCSVAYPFICTFSKYAITTPWTTTGKDMSTCPSGWHLNNDTKMCYGVGYDKTYNDAEKFCNSFNGHLASVHSDAENDFIKDLTYDDSCERSENNYIRGTTILGGQIDVKTNKVEWWADNSTTDYTKELCGSAGSGPNGNTILMSSYPETCYFCANGKWSTNPFERDQEVFPTFVCKTAANL